MFKNRFNKIQLKLIEYENKNLTTQLSEFKYDSVGKYAGLDLILFSMRLYSRFMTEGRTRMVMVRAGDVITRTGERTDLITRIGDEIILVAGDV